MLLIYYEQRFLELITFRTLLSRVECILTELDRPNLIVITVSYSKNLIVLISF
jgi:hypothetical protein